MRTETQIETLKTEFVEWLDEEGHGCTEEDVVRTADTVQNFLDACREYKSVDTDTMNGMKVTTIEASQRFKGETRADLYILDVEEHVRLVVTF